MKDDDTVWFHSCLARPITPPGPGSGGAGVCGDLFFCDGGGKRDDPDGVVRLLVPGGVLVLDDFTPGAGWPPRYAGEVDELRLRYLTDPRLRATEVQVSDDQAVILATRV